jgi:hypothetical protein
MLNLTSDNSYRNQEGQEMPMAMIYSHHSEGSVEELQMHRTGVLCSD